MPRYRIRIGKLFKTDPTLTIHLIRLMAAENDFFTTLVSMERLPESKNRAERLQISGQRLYFFRVTCGHLHEAIQVLKQLHTDCPQVLVQAPPELGEAYNKIATTIFPLEKKLSRLRAHATFHYDRSELVDVLKYWGEDADGETEIGEGPSQVRHAIADEAFSTVISRSFGFPEGTEERKKAFMDLIDQLVTVQIEFVGYVRMLMGTVRAVYPETIEALEE